ncbi:MAG: GNAT family N-acetyltransferase [Saccharofermentanales bacterium]
MEIVSVKNIREYRKFIRSIYKDDDCFKDNKSGLLPVVCGRKSAFYKNSTQKMVAVKIGGKTLCQAIFIRHKNSMDIVSVAFFEALPDRQDAVDMLINDAYVFAEQSGNEKAQKIIFGLYGHCNNGVGFGTASKSSPSFGESYDKEYYREYFKQFDKIGFVSYIGSIEHAKEQINRDMALLKNRKNDFIFELADFSASGFRRTMKRYTDLNNEIFSGQRYYFSRKYEEDFELFNAMKPLLKNENLIFARKNDKDVGFVLWYPDFNEFAAKGRGAGISTFLRYKILRQSPKSAKMVEIGVAGGLKNSALILMLFAKAIGFTDKYKKMSIVMSSWILDENTSSKNISQRYTKYLYKKYTAYEKNI